MDDALRGQETSNYELTFETKSKEIRYLLVNATTRRDAKGNVSGVVGGQYRFLLSKQAHSIRLSIFFTLLVHRLLFCNSHIFSFIAY
jgi:hypothetical protein